MWVLYATMVLGMLHNTITTTSRSNLSKLLEENEVGTDLYLRPYLTPSDRVGLLSAGLSCLI